MIHTEARFAGFFYVYGFTNINDYGSLRRKRKTMRTASRQVSLLLSTLAYGLASTYVFAQTVTPKTPPPPPLVVTATNTQTKAKPAQIYKVIAADGTITFTDKPSDNAEPMTFDIKTQNVVDSAPTPTILPKQTITEPKRDYRVTIQSPESEATIRNNLGEITIKATQSGASKASIYRLVFDDAPYASNSSGVFKLNGIHRGAHTFKVELINNKGKTLASSPTQTLYLHQASALINN